MTDAGTVETRTLSSAYVMSRDPKLQGPCEDESDPPRPTASPWRGARGRGDATTYCAMLTFGHGVPLCIGNTARVYLQCFMASVGVRMVRAVKGGARARCVLAGSLSR